MKLWSSIILAVLLVFSLLSCCVRDDGANSDRKIAVFSRNLELNPRDAQSFLERGLLYARKGDWQRAVADFTRARELKPKEAQAYFCLVSTHGVFTGIKTIWTMPSVCSGK